MDTDRPELPQTDRSELRFDTLDALTEWTTHALDALRIHAQTHAEELAAGQRVWMEEALDALRAQLQLHTEEMAGQQREWATTAIDVVRSHAQRQAEELVANQRAWTEASLARMKRLIELTRPEPDAPGRAAPAEATPAAQPSSDGHAADAVSPLTYFEFEAEYRGSEELIRERLTEYTRFVETAPSGLPLYDFGCGRGEWLELVQATGRPAIGIDNNRLMVRETRSKGFEVIEGDIFDVLGDLADGSAGVVSAFHLIEHLPGPELTRFITEAARVLAPGGRFIIETPNPMNVTVGAATFWTDITHVRPVPHTLATFICAHAGLVVDEVLFLHPVAPDETFDESTPAGRVLAAAHRSLLGAQDYGVVATAP